MFSYLILWEKKSAPKLLNLFHLVNIHVKQWQTFYQILFLEGCWLMGEATLIVMTLNILFKYKSIYLVATAHGVWYWNALFSSTPPHPSKIENPRNRLFSVIMADELELFFLHWDLGSCLSFRRARWKSEGLLVCMVFTEGLIFQVFCL